MRPIAKKNSASEAIKEAVLPVYNIDGKEIESITLDPKIFDGTVNAEAVYQAVNAYRANQRQGLAATKTRGEVSGGGKKPWKQKGTGRARVGSIRSPLWRHGGVVFGPHPRDFSYSVPQKIRALALKSSLNTKMNEQNLVILDAFKLAQFKTKDAVRVFDNLKVAPSAKNKRNKSVLFLVKAFDIQLKLALRNIDYVDTVLAKDVHSYEVLSHTKVVVTKAGLKDLSERMHPAAPIAAKAVHSEASK